MNAESLPESTDVVIVGAGPAGLALATLLADQQVEHVVLDQQEAGSNTSRAAVVHARTLEVLDAVGVTDALRAKGTVVPTFTVHDRNHRLLNVDFRHLPSRYPYTLMVPQSDTEAILAARLHELGGRVWRPYQAIAVEQDASGATVTVQRPDGDQRTIRARYVVGTDGMHSTVREQAGIGFTGGRYEESFVLADVRMDWPRGREQVELLLSPAGVTVVAPLPGNRYRVVATVDEAPKEPTLADIQQLLDSRGPGGSGARISELVWSSRFRVHHRVANAYRAGHLLLAGDAAHVHSPAGGQGMNTGIQDAVALGQLLTAVIRDGAPETRIDEYEAARRPVAQQVVAFTDRMTRMATLDNTAARTLRNAVVSIIGRIPAFRRKLAMSLSELTYR